MKFEYTDMLSGSMKVPTFDNSAHSVVGNSVDGRARITRIVPDILGKDSLNISVGGTLDTSNLCVDNGSGCEIVRVSLSNTTSLNAGIHPIYFVVKDNAGVTYRIDGTLYVGESKPNLITGLDDTDTTISNTMSYNISNGVVTVTADEYDGCGFTTGIVELKAGKEYIFSAKSDGIWGVAYLDTVEAFFMLDAITATYYLMYSNANYRFTPTVSGTYWLRLDVNKKGATHTFSEIKVVEAD